MPIAIPFNEPLKAVWLAALLVAAWLCWPIVLGGIVVFAWTRWLRGATPARRGRGNPFDAFWTRLYCAEAEDGEIPALPADEEAQGFADYLLHLRRARDEAGQRVMAGLKPGSPRTGTA